MNAEYLFTSESVSEGHPDKMADQISDAILDAYLKIDPDSKVACETFLTHKAIIIGGEIFSKAKILDKIPEIVKEVINEIGYDIGDAGYDTDELTIDIHLHEQSDEINSGVVKGGAGDQGLMFGYACKESPTYMPLALQLSHDILLRLSKLRKSGSIPWLLPDAKSQVTLRYKDNRPIGIEAIVVSTQHMPMVLKSQNPFQPSGNRPHGHYSEGMYRVTQGLIERAIINDVIIPSIPKEFLSENIKYIINPSGSFTKGGPAADTGLTGRKIIVDTYGGSCPHGGGAFSGKDASKVDRSGAYMTRYIAKNIVAAGIAERCVVQLAYIIAQNDPISFMLDFQGTGRIDESIVVKTFQNHLDLTPEGIINKLQLKRPIYRETAAYGHFGRENDAFLWENTDMVELLKKVK
ncbi:MAG: methionine adenosyltransferase [Bacteroidales bacterium]|jgi:S-adenosylmethionine synthetase|nr:methionine adenosyltransferase [Bacteroidales bacterium]